MMMMILMKPSLSINQRHHNDKMLKDFYCLQRLKKLNNQCMDFVQNIGTSDTNLCVHQYKNTLLKQPLPSLRLCKLHCNMYILRNGMMESYE